MKILQEKFRLIISKNKMGKRKNENDTKIQATKVIASPNNPFLSLCAKPDVVFLTLQYLTGDPNKEFIRQRYREDVCKFFAAAPKIFAKVRHEENFHHLIRKGVEQTVYNDLLNEDNLSSVTLDQFGRLEEHASRCLRKYKAYREAIKFGV